MLEALTQKLQSAFHRLGSHGTITEKDLDEAMREVRIALLEADVNFKVVRQFIDSVRQRTLGAGVLSSLTGPSRSSPSSRRSSSIYWAKARAP